MNKFAMNSLLAVSSCLAVVGTSQAHASNSTENDRNQTSQIHDNQTQYKKGRHHKGKNHGRMSGSKGMFAKLNLTETQKLQIKAIKKSQSESRKAQRESHKAEREQMYKHMQALMNNPQLDMIMLNNLATQKAEKSKARFIEQVKNQHTIAQILTPEQRAQLETMRLKHKKHGKGHGKGHRGNFGQR